MPDEGARRNVAATLSAIAGLIVVLVGILTVFIIALVSLKVLDQESSRVALATSAFGVIGTIVGAYFGLKVGSAGKEQSELARQAESIKVQELSARLDPAQHADALASADKRIETMRDFAPSQS